ncbi:unnamed protein product [Parascedosporium putredinis]|uniref:Uncharacterized protein n=1 Tax=Parascedosporium putredinis TaxID=1442378 RepID=A0A9P1H340_9PEZI|nr:unnamed protein product [Parascedosporium putredinis]CAI7994196.1 unnamed protein product [Parascedosporium putredinis]
MGRLRDSLKLIEELKYTIHPTAGKEVSAFVQDASRFIPSCYQTVAMAPLQIYSSALLLRRGKHRATGILSSHGLDNEKAPS